MHWSLVHEHNLRYGSGSDSISAYNTMFLLPENQKIVHTIRLVYTSLSPEVMKAAQREDIQVKSLGSSFSFPQIQNELINIG